MNFSRLSALTASLFLCACTSTYNGRVITKDGSPVGGARIQAMGSWSLFSRTPFDWSSGMHARGSASSFTDGTFRLQASAFRVKALMVESEAGVGMFVKPSPGEILTIMVKPKAE